MRRYAAMTSALTLMLGGASAAAAQDRAMQQAVIGRWDIAIQDTGGRTLPSWVEIRRSGRSTLVGQFVGVVGSARPVARVDLGAGGELRFAIPPQWEEERNDLVVEGRLQGEQMTGTMTFPDGRRLNWTAKRAPALRRKTAPQWGTPIRMISGTTTAGWHALGGVPNQWVVENGVLRSPRSGANLATDRTFGDFKLHAEFRYPKGSNSGIYLRGRHEVQIEDSPDSLPWVGGLGAVYGFIAPSELAGRAPGEWQSYDITLVGRMLTVVLNGKTIICNQEIPGITGGALDSDEGAPGPIYLQGDHGPIEYRNITITPAK